MTNQDHYRGGNYYAYTIKSHACHAKVLLLRKGSKFKGFHHHLYEINHLFCLWRAMTIIVYSNDGNIVHKFSYLCTVALRKEAQISYMIVPLNNHLSQIIVILLTSMFINYGNFNYHLVFESII